MRWYDIIEQGFKRFQSKRNTLSSNNNIEDDTSEEIIKIPLKNQIIDQKRIDEIILGNTQEKGED